MISLFTKRHFEWFVDMMLTLRFSESQKNNLIVILHPTNDNFNEELFRLRYETKLDNRITGKGSE